MDNSFWKRGPSVILALFLACLMMMTPLVGIDNPPIMSSSENTLKVDLVDDFSTLFSDDMPLRMGADLVYDSESDRVIFFGGATENIYPEYDETWSYDFNTNTWTNMSPATHPPVSEWHQMTYHSGLDRVVLFGGHVSGTGSSWKNHNQTWTYDFNTNAWANMTPALAPPAMCSGSMAYDSESDLIVLFGGWSDAGVWDLISETWSYDLGSNTWTNVTQSVQPMARAWPTMTYDNESDNIVFFGGFETETAGIPTLTDTWTFDANTNTWTEISTVGPTIIGELVYDSESDLVVFYGGTETFDEGLDVLRSETWTYDTNTETWEMMIHETKPPPRSRGEVVYDGESDRIIVFGGGEYFGHGDSEKLYHDCWAYDLNNNLWNNVNSGWQEMTPTESPEPNAYPAMTYDSESDLTVLFGGHTEEQFQANGYWGDNETWTYNYNTNTWTNMSPSNAPSMRGMADMVYDEESDIIILYGGGRFGESDFVDILNDTWAYDVNTDTWMDMAPALNPGIRAMASMTYDSKLDRIILLGGYNGTHNQESTWMYDYNTNTWTEMSPGTSPVPRHAAAFAYDEESELSVLFGGYVIGYPYQLDDTWVYNSTADTWTEMSPAYHPLKRSELRAVYDSSVDRVIMFGGWAYDVFYEETWSYDYNTNTWIEMNTLNAPSARYWYGVAFNSESNRTILFSGDQTLDDSREGWQADTWAYKYQINPPGAPVLNPVSLVVEDLVLTWTAPMAHPETPITGYNVYRSMESGVYALLAELGDVLTYTDTSVTPGFPHYYVVAADTAVGEGAMSNEEFGLVPKPPVPNDDIWTFIAYGDTRSSDATSVSPLHQIIVSEYLDHDPEMTLHTGDMVNRGGEAYQWPLFEASISAVRDADIPFYGAVGNHEWYTDVYGVNDEDFSTYLDYVDYSDVVDGDETELYYSFNWQRVHFIVLNTVEGLVDDNFTCPAAQMDWLMSDLAGNYEFIVVLMHNPSYCIRAGHEGRLVQAESVREQFHDIFVEHGVDIVFAGHDHYYYRTVRDDIQYVVTGGGGAPLYDIQADIDTDWQPGDVGFSDYHYCVCRINNVTNQLDVEVFLMGEDTPVDEIHLDLPEVLTNTTDGEIIQIPWDMVIVVVGGAGVVIVVLVLIVRKRR